MNIIFMADQKKENGSYLIDNQYEVKMGQKKLEKTTNFKKNLSYTDIRGCLIANS